MEYSRSFHQRPSYPSPYTAKVRYRWGLPDPFMAYGGDFIFKDLTIRESSVARTKVRGPDFDYGQGCFSSPPCPKRTNTCQEANRVKREFLHSQHGRAACKLSVSHPLYAFWPRCHDTRVNCMPAESTDTRKASAQYPTMSRLYEVTPYLLYVNSGSAGRDATTSNSAH